ncbi:MAG: DUF1385 domain-containing protein [candidate division Zixibacteria bacterium]|nr:DUF1385 domain-containing protein [candidate division Zixibacteria bacterium]
MAKPKVGGQAVIEGVMMRSPWRISTAIRKADGGIEVKSQDYVALSKRYKILSIPILRGVINFFEMLVIGISTLNFSANFALEEAEKLEGKKPSSKRSKDMALALTVIIAFGLGMLVFFFFPLFISNLFGISRDAFAFNLLTGLIRVSLFLAYLWGISFFGEFKKIFQYHGAEHKTIYAYENGESLDLENVRKHSTQHPRCGTSFIFLVLVFAILFYSLSDSIYSLLAGSSLSLAKRMLFHFMLLPLVAGGVYELLKLSDLKSDNPLIKILNAPGLWLQKITTQEPNQAQLEVGIRALEDAVAQKGN